MQPTIEHASQASSAERRLRDLAIHLPVPPEPLGTYTEAVQAGSLLFLSGTLPTEGRTAKFVGRVGAELDLAAGHEAARLAAMNAFGIARRHFGSLDRVKRVVRLGVSVATEGNVSDLPKVADGVSDFLQDGFGPDKTPTRLVYGVASLPFGTPVEVDLILEVRG
jgi:enamine deaminase RidA (YjgF/YER057c/UK114 family)